MAMGNHSLLGPLRRLNQSFGDRAEEASFKQSLEKQVLSKGAVGAACFSLLILAAKLPLFIQQTSRADQPFEWSSADPRSQCFVIHSILVLVAMLYGAWTTLRFHFGYLQAWNWELLFLCFAGCNLIALPFADELIVAGLWGRRAEDIWAFGVTEQTMMLHLMSPFLMVSYACLNVPCRAHVSWPLAICAIAPFLFLSLEAKSLRSRLSLAVSAVCMFMNFCLCFSASCWKESVLREVWLGSRQLNHRSDQELCEQCHEDSSQDDIWLGSRQLKQRSDQVLREHHHENSSQACKLSVKTASTRCTDLKQRDSSGAFSTRSEDPPSLWASSFSSKVSDSQGEMETQTMDSILLPGHCSTQSSLAKCIKEASPPGEPTFDPVVKIMPDASFVATTCPELGQKLQVDPASRCSSPSTPSSHRSFNIWTNTHSGDSEGLSSTQHIASSSLGPASVMNRKHSEGREGHPSSLLWSCLSKQSCDISGLKYGEEIGNLRSPAQSFGTSLFRAKALATLAETNRSKRTLTRASTFTPSSSERSSFEQSRNNSVRSAAEPSVGTASDPCYFAAWQSDSNAFQASVFDKGLPQPQTRTSQSAKLVSISIAPRSSTMPTLCTFSQQDSRRSSFTSRKSSFDLSEQTSFAFTQSSKSHEKSLQDAATQTNSQKMLNVDTQTIAVTSIDAAVGTTMVWEEGVFKCRGCVKPPKLPDCRSRSESPSHKPLEVQQPQIGASRSSCRSFSAPASELQTTAQSNIVKTSAQSKFVETSLRGRAKSLGTVMKRWVLQPSSACCPWHAAIDAILDTAKFLHDDTECNPHFAPLTGWQCKYCTVICTTSVEKCVICGRPKPNGEDCAPKGSPGPNVQ